jgi:hypothetical protein
MGGAAIEFEMLSLLLRKSEYDVRGKDLPEHRRMEIDDACSRYGMKIPQAFSLRRSLLRQKLGPEFYKRNSFGQEAKIVQFAALFESTVARFLQEKQVTYITEAEQKATLNKRVSTPDFLIHPSHNLEINGKAVRWLDCKAFYGAAMFNNIKASRKKWVPVAKLSDTAERYTTEHGPGAFVMGQGFNIDLEKHLSTNCVGTFLLDSTPLDMSDMEAFFQNE